MRNILAIVGLVVAATIIGAFVFLYGGNTFPSRSSLAPAYNNPPDKTTIPFTELAHGAHSSIPVRANYLITSEDQLSELWKMIDAGGQTPKVDFATQSVIAIFAGQKPTAGYTIAVSNVEDAATRDVTITLTSPGGSCLLAQSLTAPYQVVELPKTSLAFTHKDLATTLSCLQ
ncbi:protease complex subunit PrcB family protein [Patescibacteria group bacterium]|nr:protease complex subunit PrcB family protein [Patescibacteria group bacterium]MDE2173526.1 protease complex subunit PrcB family protein [Patescibacteria group bacterium]